MMGTAPGAVAVREQSFQYDVVNHYALLSRYLGKQVTVRQDNPGGPPTVTTGVLVGMDGLDETCSGYEQSLTIRTADKVVIARPDSVELPELPEGLVVRPTLEWHVECTRAGKHQTQLSYIANQIGWSCDYVAVVNAQDTRADLNGWVALDNQSGAAYRDAKPKLVAGDIRHQSWRAPREKGGGAPPPGAVENREEFVEQSFFEYHLYDLQRPTTVRDRESKQIELLSAQDVPVKKVYTFDGQRQRGTEGQATAQVKIEFMNAQKDHLGMPLPQGRIRVYKADGDGSLQFVGEDRIDHTPKDEKVSLTLGGAFDVVGEWKQTAQRQVSARVQETTVEIVLRNHKQQDVTVTCVEHAEGHWAMVTQSRPHTLRDASTFEFQVPVKANGEAKVTYTIRTAE
jgi:hypothetical protein